jgi:hypothetical protein
MRAGTEEELVGGEGGRIRVRMVRMVRTVR